MSNELTRRGYEAEVNRHRANLAKALDEVQRVTANLANRTARGEAELSSESLRLLAAAGDVVRHAGEADAAEQLSFTLDER